VLSFVERSPVVDPTPASPRLIAGLSSLASAGPIGCTSGRCAFDLGVLAELLGLSGFFAIAFEYGMSPNLRKGQKPREEPALPRRVCAVSRCQRVPDLVPRMLRSAPFFGAVRC